MSKEMTALKFYFRNGETWTINRRHIGDLWIKQITTSFGRINGSEFMEILDLKSKSSMKGIQWQRMISIWADLRWECSIAH